MGEAHIPFSIEFYFLFNVSIRFQDYLKVLNDFRTSLPQRLNHLEPTDSEVKEKVQEVSTAFQNLLNRIDRLGDKFAVLNSKQRNFAEAMEKASTWLSGVAKTTKKVVDEPTAADPRAIQDQLDRVKALNMELMQQGRLIDGAKGAASSLLDAFEVIVLRVALNYFLIGCHHWFWIF